MEMAEPTWSDLREWLSLIESCGELQKVDALVNPDQEVSAITFMASRKDPSPAFLFSSFPENKLGARILTNMLGSSSRRFALAMGLDPNTSIRDLVQYTRVAADRRITPIHIPETEAPINENVFEGDSVDLTRFPVPTFWPNDGGPYFGTGCVVMTKDPDSGRLNAGVYRQQLHGPRKLGISFVPGRNGESDCEKHWAQGKPCEVVVALGTDPILFMAASQKFPPGTSELDVAGGISGRPVELTKSRCLSLPIPARAELVIEGVIREGVTDTEGPLGEFHGFYSGDASRKPVIDVLAVHYRHAPIMSAALMAVPPSCEIGVYHSVMRSARILDELAKIGISGVRGVYCPPAAAAGNCIVIIAVEQSHPGHAAQALALAAHCPAASYYTKWVIVVDHDVDPTSMDEVLWAISTRCNPSDDLDVLRHTMSFRADPSLAPEVRPVGSKVLVNACVPYPRRNAPPKRTQLRRDVYEKVVERWQELGLNGTAPVIQGFHERET